MSFAADEMEPYGIGTATAHDRFFGDGNFGSARRGCVGKENILPD